MGVLILDGLHHLKTGHADLVGAGDAGRALIRAHFAGHPHGGFLRDVADGLEQIIRQIALESDALHKAIAITDQQEDQLPLVRAIVDPSLDGDLFSNIVGNIFDANHRRCHNHFSLNVI